MKFGKPAIPLADQLAKLKSRGLVVGDDAAALDRLASIGYYRLAGYAFPFLVAPARASFKPGTTTLEQILRLYAFDRDLRLLTTDAVERLEIAARSRIVNESCLALGAHWFLDAGHFQPRFNHRDFLEKAEKASGVKTDRRTGAQRLPTTHPETFVTHYYARYGDPYLPPFWMTAELLTLGTVSRVYAGIGDNAIRQKIAKAFDLHDRVFGACLHSLAYLRNVCAHHGRLWNRSFSIKPPIPKRLNISVPQPERYYAHAVVLMDMLRHADGGTRWGERLKQLFADYPEIDAAAMGFPPGWENEPLWKP